jgi:disulfide bond formation protein DsbB
MQLPSSRATHTLIFIVCAGLMAVAFYMEFVKGFEPCPLCMAQRVAVVGVGLVALFAALHGPGKKGVRVYSIAMMLFSGLGIFLAGRQLWLQSLPEDLVPACGPGIYYMLDAFPLGDTIRTMMMGSGDCATVVWQDPVIGLSIPGWTFVWFIAMTLVALYQFFRKAD